MSVTTEGSIVTTTNRVLFSSKGKVDKGKTIRIKRRVGGKIFRSYHFPGGYDDTMTNYTRIIRRELVGVSRGREDREWSRLLELKSVYGTLIIVFKLVLFTTYVHVYTYFLCVRYLSDLK